MSIRAIKKEEFNLKVKVKFNNVLDGFENFKYKDLSPILDKEKSFIEEDFIRAVQNFFDLNDDNLIIDFYKSRLDENSIKIIKDSLDTDEIKLFDDILNEGEEHDIYFEITDKIYIKLLVKLCTRELFFITFYFSKHNATLWGNYNFKFPFFYIDEDDIKEYIDIAKDNNLL